MIRKQFKQQRAEAVAAAEAEAEVSFASNPDAAPVITTLIPSTQTAGLNRQLQTIISAGDDEPLPELTVEETPENMEHLQLSLQEAFFLAWTTSCLLIREPESGEPISLPDFWTKCQTLWSPLQLGRIDNPFLVHYVAYHHFRALGWVVKSGIKFCVDYLLYKKGPVFHHAEFAVAIIPSYTDVEDRETSPYNLPNTEPISWQWFSTLNRANAQVMKVRFSVDLCVVDVDLTLRPWSWLM
jgi:tRNA-splicing endonuclease subunit Sen2